MSGKVKAPSLAHTILLSPPEQFLKFARAIFAVPKKDIDEKLAEHKAHKHKPRKLPHA